MLIPTNFNILRLLNEMLDLFTKILFDSTTFSIQSVY